jgi:PAS domain S-box-containing protein
VLRDVTDEWEARERIRQRDEQYRKLVDLFPDMIVIHQGGRLVFVNEAGVRLMRASSVDDLIGQDVMQFVHEDDRGRVSDRIAKLLSEGGVVPPLEETFLRLDGSSVEVDVTATTCTFEGKPAIQLVARDLTSRREAERQARSSEAKLAAVIDSRPDWVLAIDREGRVLTANRATREAMEAYSGKPFEYGANPFSFIPQDSATRFRERLDKAFSGESFRVEQDFDFRGTLMHLDISFAPIIEGREVVAVSVICQDVSERVRAQRQLAQSERRFRSLVEGLRLVAYDFDPKSRQFTYVSPLAEYLLGYPHKDWHELGFWRRALHPEDRDRISRYALAKENACEDHEMEYRLIAKNGTTVWVRDIVSVIAEGGVPIRLTGVLLDITQNRILEEQLLQTRKLEAIGRLAGGIAHDFNNMLSAIIGFSELIEMDPALPETVKPHLAGLTKAADKASGLTGQLLTFARQKASQREITDLNALIESMKDLIERLLGDSIDLQLKLADDLALVEADSTQLEQVLINLVLNGRDAMPDGGTLRISTANVHVAGVPAISEVMDSGSYATISVKDIGEGMSEDVAARAFEPFFTTKPVGRGTGLGLAVCHGVIANHGGTIKLSTAPEQGTDVVIYLPVAYDQSASSAQSTPFAGMSTLVFHSDSEHLQRLSDCLLKLGFQVTTASSVRGASRMLDANRFNLMVAPDEAGNTEVGELLQKARAAFPNMRVLLIVGEEGKPGGGAIGRTADAFLLHSPFRVADIARALELLVRGS